MVLQRWALAVFRTSNPRSYAALYFLANTVQNSWLFCQKKNNETVKTRRCIISPKHAFTRRDDLTE